MRRRAVAGKRIMELNDTNMSQEMNEYESLCHCLRVIVVDRWKAVQQALSDSIQQIKRCGKMVSSSFLYTYRKKVRLLSTTVT
jgi:hypothetical protein